jgi:hypothetical protein
MAKSNNQYYTLKVPYEQLPHVLALFGQVLRGQIESFFDRVTEDAKTEWLVRTDYRVEKFAKFLNEQGVSLVEITEEEARKILEEDFGDWEEGWKPGLEMA